MPDQKESFVYRYTRPTHDWFDYVNVEIRPDDYIAFKLQRRFGPSWWLMGINIVEYTIVETQIGQIDNIELARFIEWAKTERGSKITHIDMLCSDFDIFAEVKAISPDIKTKEA